MKLVHARRVLKIFQQVETLKKKFSKSQPAAQVSIYNDYIADVCEYLPVEPAPHFANLRVCVCVCVWIWAGACLPPQGERKCHVHILILMYYLKFVRGIRKEDLQIFAFCCYEESIIQGYE